jgi:hypothetical protein
MLSLHIQNICLDGAKEGNNNIHVQGKIEAKIIIIIIIIIIIKEKDT